ncbi:RNase H family protein [Planotetraspora mira]|uniref:ribonuclease H n=1 Tax=Planotetraspora mira TaxID=58121 RepID=A0A8J3TPI9_9ACTN|nr:hypothetical protein Pmi06nite_17010 [Planotetraspora mira]
MSAPSKALNIADTPWTLGNSSSAWANILRIKHIWGGEPEQTTNNRMELLAACRALESLTKPATVRLHTDSQYVRQGITEWVPRWHLNGWTTAARTPSSQSSGRHTATSIPTAVSAAMHAACAAEMTPRDPAHGT